MVSIDYKSNVLRNYSDFSIWYNLKNQTIITLQSVAMDIIQFIFDKHRPVNLIEIAAHISSLYEVPNDIAYDDTVNFINELINKGYLSNRDMETESKSDIVVNANDMEGKDVEGEVISILSSRNQIFSATLELTYLCNEKCVHCYAIDCGESLEEKILDLNTCKRIVDELYDLNCCCLNFTGGDPFMFRGFPELFQYARKKNFVCSIYTNGQTLATEQGVLEEISSWYPKAIYISLYGATEEIHDSITQIPGSFKKTILSARELITRYIPVVFQIMVMKPNYHQLSEMIDLAKRLKADYRVGLSIINKNNGDSTPQQYFINNKAEIKAVMKASAHKFFNMELEAGVLPKEPTMSICGAGITSICISPDGTVYPCVSLKMPLGSVFQTSLEGIWHSKQREDLIKKLIWDNTEKCLDCTYYHSCPHCVGISYAESGNALKCNECDYLLAQCTHELSSI